MTAHKTTFSIKLIYWITNIFFWLFNITGLLALILVIGMAFNMFGNVQLHVGVPVAIDVLEQGTITVNKTIINADFSEMYGKVHFIDTPVFIGRLYSIFLLIILGLGLYISFTFKKFIKNIYLGIYFEVKNISLLKRISYAVIIGWVYSVSYSYFQYFYIMKNINFETIKINGEVKTYPMVLFAALFLWVLSHIFIKGAELQQDNKLTI